MVSSYNLFEDISLQDRVWNILNGFIESDKIPSAILFEGPEGIGKFFTALKFSLLLNHSDDPSENIKLKQKILNLSEPYIKLIFPLPRGKNELPGADNPYEKIEPDELKEIKDELALKSANPFHKIEIKSGRIIKISSILNIRKFLSFDYPEIKRRIIIILDAHLMHDESQNSLLKSLEEPPPGVTFILTTTNSDLLYETIRSRCWKIKFQPLSEDNFVKIINHFYDFDKDDISLAAKFAEGSITTGIGLLQKNVNEFIKLSISIFTDSLLGNFYSAINKIQQLYDSEEINLKYFINFINYLIGYELYRRYSDIGKLGININSDLFSALQKLDNSKAEHIMKMNEKIINVANNNINLNIRLLSIIFTLNSIVQQEDSAEFK